MVFWPPGHAKSTYASHLGPAWIMGRNPTSAFVHCSHTEALAWRFGRRIRNTLRSRESTEVFGELISKEVRAAGEWETIQGGEYLAAGVGGAITGRRFGIGLIDDPVKGRKEADSPTYRDSQWEWYLGDFRSRALPSAAMVLIQTRWHEDDLAGRILPKDYDFRSGLVQARDGEWWYVLNFPAICEREDDLSGRAIGEALWPGFYTEKRLEQEKRSQGTRNWQALYQQRPRPGEGGIFKEAWFKNTRFNLEAIPIEARTCVHSWDTAQKEEDIVNDRNWSALTSWRFGRGAPGFFLQEAFRERMSFPDLVRKVINFAERDKPSAILIEDKASGISLIQTLRANTNLPVIPIEPEGDKIFRGHEVSWMAEAGLMRLPYKAPWLVDYEGELFGFPLAADDDQVDSTTQFLRWIRPSLGAIESAGTGAREVERIAGPRKIETDKGFGSVSRSHEE